MAQRARLLLLRSNVSHSLKRTIHSKTAMAPQKNAFDRLIAGNRVFANRSALRDEELMESLSKAQHPQILWLGCSDSRVPETTICDLKPGDLFVHRNIANVITTKDVSSASVLDFAVGQVGVKYVIVCGHTKCGGANASLGDADLGEALNTWLDPVRQLRKKHQAELDKLENTDAKAIRLAELNALLSVEAVKQNAVVQKAMKDRDLQVYGAIYDIPTGELRILETPVAQSAPHNR